VTGTSTAEIAAEERQLIGGERVGAVDGTLFEVLDPSTGNRLTEVPDGKAADVDGAIEAARRAFSGWRRSVPADRGRLLTNVARRLREHSADLAVLGSLDGGLPLAAVERDVEASARYFEFYGGLADKIGGDVVPLGPDYLDYTEREPWGVCGVILPYNSPFQILARSLAPALAAGNAVVAKAAEQAPLGPLRLAALLELEGLPPGVLNVVTGGGQAGARLAEHPDVDRITFTGSEPTGRRVMHAAAEQLKPVTLELGGKSPQIIFADADLELAARTVVSSLVWSAGQACSAGTRVLVEERVRDEVLETVVESMRSTTVGPAVESPDMGPLITEQQRSSVVDAIAAASDQGARLVTGGTDPPPGRDGGYFVAPTVFDEVDPGSTLAQEEIFGPVVAVMGFDSTSDAVELGNNTRFGLVAGLWTRDLSRAHRVARELRCGQVFVNTYSAGTGIELPFGGYKKSGIGREKGIAGYLEYTQVKNICIKVDSHG